LLGIANFSYLTVKKDYFDNVFEDPLHHTWSLGVEEQFYLIYPFFLTLCFFLFKKEISKIILTLIFLTIIGVYAAHQFSENSMLIFYLPFFRFWQFLFGTSIFFLLLKYKKKNSLISLLSFFLIFFVIFSQNYFNEFYKLFFVTFFSGIFLLFYNKKNFLSFCFDNKQLIYFGNISYSFYLWHLPFIYFYDLYYVNSLIRVPIVFILTLVVSLLSYKYIEQKFRYYNFNKVVIKKYILLFGLLILTVLFSIYFISFQKSYESNTKKNLKNLFSKFNYLEQKRNYSNRVIFYKHKINGNEVYNFCKKESKNYNFNFLNLKNECLKNDTTKKIFFLEGNSHTANFVTMFENSKFIENFYYSHINNINTNNQELNKKINELSEHFDEFFYTTAIITHKELDIFQERIKGLNENIKFLIIGPIPTFDNGIEPIKCFIKKINCFFDTSSDIQRVKIINKKIIELAESDKIFFYDPYEVICAKEICHVYNKKEDLLTHQDDSHLTVEGSKLHVPHFYNYYKNNLN